MEKAVGQMHVVPAQPGTLAVLVSDDHTRLVRALVVAWSVREGWSAEERAYLCENFAEPVLAYCSAPNETVEAIVGYELADGTRLDAEGCVIAREEYAALIARAQEKLRR